MIGRLQGTLLEKQPPSLLVDIGGVGYELEAPMSTFYGLPETGSQVTLHTHLVVREDAHLLYGFASQTERAMFRTLIKVSGVGAKMALAILSGISAAEFARCVQDDDTATLVKLPGIGKKTAERLIVEMRDRIRDWGGSESDFAAVMTGSPGGTMAEIPADATKEALTALVALGYKPPEASRMITRVEGADELSTEELIRAALKGAVS
ncbi:MAG: Holliday junction branch migration protein RuvA [Gammaproteobacteria bacterium]|nr:Holliday junction branch migration protein RuvA [Gammaproteobacteria bacterium]